MRRLFVVMLAVALLLLSACGFAEEYIEVPLEEVGIANPWKETTSDELYQVYGYQFAIPNDAEDIVYLINDELQMAEMRFYLDSASLTARVSAMDPEDISGVYYDHWDAEERCRIDVCEGLARRVFDGDRTIDVCLWYDAEKGMTWSVVAEADDLDGFDITAVAEQLYMVEEPSSESREDREEDETDPFENDWDSDEEDVLEDLYASQDYPYTEVPEDTDADEYYGESNESEAYDYSEDDGNDTEPEADTQSESDEGESEEQ